MTRRTCGPRCATPGVSRDATNCGRTPISLPSAADLDDPIGFAQHAGELADIDITDFLPDEGPSDQPPTQGDDGK